MSTAEKSGGAQQTCVSVRVHVCVCVRVHVRERERQKSDELGSQQWEKTQNLVALRFLSQLEKLKPKKESKNGEMNEYADEFFRPGSVQDFPFNEEEKLEKIWRNK